MIPLTISDVKPRLGSLVDRVISGGEPITIRRGKSYVQIVQAVMPEAIPVYPVGSLVFDPNEFPFSDESISEGEDVPLDRL